MPVIPAAMRPDGMIYPAYPEHLSRDGWKSVLYDTDARRVVNEGEGGAVPTTPREGLETIATPLPVEQPSSPPSPSSIDNDSAASIATMTRDDLAELYATLYGSPPGLTWNSAKLRKEVLTKL